MKGKLVMALSMLMLISLPVLLSSCSDTMPEFKVGDIVAAQWTNNDWYLATIKSIEGDTYSVVYADGDKGTVTKDALKVLPKSLKLNAGDKVLGVWSSAKFYPGVAEEVKDNGAVIKWDDGSNSSFVAYGKIIKR